MGIKHKVCINIAKPGGTPSPVVRSSTMQIRKKFLDFLFGQQVSVLDLSPGDSVQTVEMENGSGACNADAIHESELQNLTVRGINMALAKKDAMNETLQENVEAVLIGADGVPLSEIDSQLEELQKERLKVANFKGNYDAIADEIYRFREVRQNALVENAEREGMKPRRRSLLKQSEQRVSM